MRISGSYSVYVYAVLLAVLSWWLARLTIEKDLNPATQVTGHIPDYYSTGYRKWETDSEGRLKSYLEAERVTHYQDDDTTHFQAPDMRLYDVGDSAMPPWRIRSENGILSADHNQVLLLGEAHIEREKSTSSRALTINTRDLTVLLDQSFAHTEAWAELISPPNRTEGVGMKLKYQEPVSIELLSRVKGYYVLN